MIRSRKHIPGVAAPASTDLPVLLAPDARRARGPEPMMVSRWLAGLPPWTPLALLAVIIGWPFTAYAQQYTYTKAFEALYHWIPFIVTQGFLFNVLISFFSMAIGTALGAVLGLGQISHSKVIARTSWFVTQLFRNSPWLVLLFIVMLAFPFELDFGNTIIPIPDWTKAVFGLSLPIMANIAEIVRGAVNSVPTAQWEASEALAFTRMQTLWRIILPQVVKRMIPPWMNWYAILTMATPLCSILGVQEIVNLSRQAIESENNHPELLVPFYAFILLIFFAYCYPIARWTIRLERRFMVKL